MHIKGQKFLVTGGASGLGASVIKMINKNGGFSFSLDLKESKDAKSSHICNIANPTEIFQLVQTHKNDFSQIKGIINCAGVAIGEKIFNKEYLSHSYESFKKVIDVNIVGTFNVISQLTPLMAQGEGCDEDLEKGIVINTASVAAFDGQMGQCAYSASKGAIASMTLPLARDLAAHQIRVMCIAPGIFNTPMLQSLPEKVKNHLSQLVPFPKRLGRPEEYALLVQHIIENPMLNGEVIRLDGSIRMI